MTNTRGRANPKYLLSGPSQKSLPTPALDHCRPHPFTSFMSCPTSLLVCLLTPHPILLHWLILLHRPHLRNTAAIYSPALPSAATRGQSHGRQELGLLLTALSQCLEQAPHTGCRKISSQGMNVSQTPGHGSGPYLWASARSLARSLPREAESHDEWTLSPGTPSLGSGKPCTTSIA